MKKITILLTILILLATFTINQKAYCKQTEITDNNILTNAEIIYIDDNNIGGPWNGTIEHPYQHIKDGILNSTDGDTIYVFSGIYYENIAVDKTIKLIGENKNNTIIDGMHGEYILKIIKDDVNIENFTIKNSGGYKENSAIKIDSENNTITHCNIYRTRTGIHLNNTKENKIINCFFNTNGEGIFLINSSENIIQYCQFCHNSIGINIQNSEKNKIYDSYAHTNGIGIFLEKSSEIEIINCAINDNNDNQGGIFLSGCDFINITNCNINHNGAGVKIGNSENISINKCSILFTTHYGFKIDGNSKNIFIENSEIKHSFRFAIRIINSQLKARNNNIYGNSMYGLYAKKSVCDVRNNWWGFFTGPAYTGLGKSDRIIRELREILYIPWQLKPLTEIGCSWETNNIFKNLNQSEEAHKAIVNQGDDADSDGCTDFWEEKWGYDPNVWNNHLLLDPDQDSLNNIEECYTDQWGSSPFYKDIFLEVDWIKTIDSSTNKPPADQLNLMILAFKKHDINLHIDVGELGGGEEIIYKSNFSYSDLKDIYWDYFLHNNLNNPRKGVFHYDLVCDYGAGSGFAFIGWDCLDSFEIAAKGLEEGFPKYSRGRLVVTGSMHEMGHTLGLFVDDFAGIDNSAIADFKNKDFWLYMNYKSCMNYLYTWDIMDYSDGKHLGRDFNDWGNLDFSFFKNTHFEWPKITI